MNKQELKKSDSSREREENSNRRAKLLSPISPQSVMSIPTLITFIRFVGSMAFFIMAVAKKDLSYNYIGLLIHWIGDFSDGFIARKFKQETIFGAELDIIADRVGFLFFYVIYMFFKPELFIPIALFVINFAFLDFYLSNQFLKFDIISINYFFKVDRTVYKWNFSPVGKFCNTVIVTLILIFLPQFWPVASVVALGLIGVKSFSIRRLFQVNHSQKQGA